MVKISQIRSWLAICQKLYGIRLTISLKVKSWLARKVMACGKGSENTINGNQLTKDNINNLSKSWLVLSKRLQVKTNQIRLQLVVCSKSLGYHLYQGIYTETIGYSRSDGFW